MRAIIVSRPQKDRNAWPDTTVNTRGTVTIGVGPMVIRPELILKLIPVEFVPFTVMFMNREAGCMTICPLLL